MQKETKTTNAVETEGIKCLCLHVAEPFEQRLDIKECGEDISRGQTVLFVDAGETIIEDGGEYVILAAVENQSLVLDWFNRAIYTKAEVEQALDNLPSHMDKSQYRVYRLRRVVAEDYCDKLKNEVTSID